MNIEKEREKEGRRETNTIQIICCKNRIRDREERQRGRESERSIDWITIYKRSKRIP